MGSVEGKEESTDLFQVGAYCYINDSEDMLCRIQQCLDNHDYVVINSENRYQIIQGQKLTMIHNNQHLQQAQNQYHQMITNIELLDEAFKHYCAEEEIEWSELFLVNWCLHNNLPDAQENLSDEFPFCDIHQDKEIRKKMMADLFEHIFHKTNKFSSPYPSIITLSAGNCNKDGNPISECDSVQRLLCGLKTYSYLDITKNVLHQSQFIEHMEEQYTEFLDDYIHLMCDHSHQVELINNALDPCDIKKCKCTFRRHSKEYNVETRENIDIQDESLRFYATTMDSLHFYLYHLFDVGLRVKSHQQSEPEEEKQTSEVEFSQICAAVKAGRAVSKSFDRFQSQAKFNILIPATGTIYINEVDDHNELTIVSYT